MNYRSLRNDRQRLATKLENGRWIAVAAHVRAHAHQVDQVFQHPTIPDFRDRYGRLFTFTSVVDGDVVSCRLAGRDIATTRATLVMNEPKGRPQKSSEPRRRRVVGYVDPEVADRITAIAAARGLAESQVVAWACEVLVTGLESQ